MPDTPDPASVGDVYLVTLQGALSNQLIINTFLYRVEYLQIANTTLAKCAVLTGMLQTPGGFQDKFLACCPDNYLLSNIWVQKISPYRVVKLVTPVADNGNSTFQALTPNVASVITRRSQFARRQDVGSVHIPSPTDDTSWVQNGQLAVGALSSLGAFATQVKTVQGTLGSTDTFAPVLGRIKNGTFVFTYVTQAFTQTTTRTMRKRTVGRGK